MALGSRSLVLIIVAAYLVSLLAVSRTERRVARVGAPAT
jgi:hypothetical protein